jgi:hypothetical protein
MIQRCVIKEGDMMPIRKQTPNPRSRLRRPTSAPFATGIARMFDVTGSLNSYRIVYRSDAEALQSDWLAVGDDIRESMRKHEEES